MGRGFPDAADYCGSSYDFEVQEYSDRIVQHDGVLKGIRISESVILTIIIQVNA